MAAELSPGRLLPRRRGAPPGARRDLLFYAAAVAGGLLAGVVSASSSIALAGVFAGLIAAMAVAVSRRALFWFVVLGGLVVTGAAQLYLPELKYFKYLLPIAAFMLLLHGVMDLLRNPAGRRLRMPAGIVFWMYAFIFIAAVSAAVNWNPGLAAQGFKDYFAVWVFFFAMVLALWRSPGLGLLPQAMLLVAFIQLPFVAHQFLVLVPLRESLGDDSIIPVDIVVGTFGGSLFGGGANAVLSLFLLVVVACLLGLWRQGALSGWRTALIGLPLLVPVLLNETKVSAVYLPVIFAVLFLRDALRRPVRFVLATGIGLGMFAVLMNAMVVLHPSEDVRSWSDFVDLTYTQQTRSMLEAEHRGEYSSLTRWTALTFWAQENLSGHPMHALIGHGPGASRVQEGEDGVSFARTLADGRYGGVKLGFTSISALLWDTGMLGTAAVLALFLSAYRTAGQLARAFQGRDPVQAGIFDGLRAAICIIVLSLAHKDFFVFNMPYQVLVLLVLGYLVVFQYRAQERTSP